MAENSAIEWTDHTFNPWFGCTKVSPGCDNCYAEHMMDTRMHKVRWGAGQPRVRTSVPYWKQPLKWNRDAAAAGVRKRVFCASLADVFDNEVDPAWRADLFHLIRETPHLDWLLLTKRIGNATQMIDDALERTTFRGFGNPRWPWSNVWLGATIVNQEEADRDIPKLLATPALVRFLSIEPILGAIDLTALQDGEHSRNALTGQWTLRADGVGYHANKEFTVVTKLPNAPRVDWVIVGGESGPKARATDLAHIRGIVHQCTAAQVPVFVKQLGRTPFVTFASGCDQFLSLDDAKGGDMAEWPDDLRIRQFPNKLPLKGEVISASFLQARVT